MVNILAWYPGSLGFDLHRRREYGSLKIMKNALV